MEEKILAQSVHYTAKKAFKIVFVIFLVLTIFATLIAFSSSYSYYEELYSKYESGDYGLKIPYKDTDSPFNCAKFPECEHTGTENDYWWGFSYYDENMTYADFKEIHPNVFSYASCIDGNLFGDAVVVFFIGLGATAVALLIVWLINLSISKYSLTVTNKRVYGNTLHGKRVDLPIDSVSSFASSPFKGIAIGTSSGKIKFNLIKNRDEMFASLSSLIVERQSQKTAMKQENKEEPLPLSQADELKKFKQLLDDGIITQEEYDEKKKQLLGL